VFSPLDHVPIKFREIESHQHNVSAQNGAQSRNFPEDSELVSGYFFRRGSVTRNSFIADDAEHAD
jgi:hypothetical protein